MLSLFLRVYHCSRGIGIGHNTLCFHDKAACMSVQGNITSLLPVLALVLTLSNNSLLSSMDLGMVATYIHVILVEKPNKQGKSNPQHILNTTPSLNCYILTRSSFTLDTQDKIKAIVERRKRQFYRCSR